MNIFALSNCPKEAAKMVCLDHKTKMPTETAEMLAFLFPEGEAPIKNSRKSSHYKHPASIWLRQSKSNFEWGLEHGFYLSSEYSRCYKREHGALAHLKWFKENRGKLSFDSDVLTPFSRCFSSYKEVLTPIKDTVAAYQKFYVFDKVKFANWPSIEEIPNFWPFKTKAFVSNTFVNGQYTKR